MTSPAGGTKETAEEAKPPWRFEPLTRFESPPASVSELARTGLQGLLHRFRDQAPPDPGSQEELQGLDPAEIAELASAPPVDGLVEALSASLPSRPDGSAAAHLCVVLEPPPGPGLEVVARLARARGMSVVEPPAAEALLGESEPILKALERRADEPLAIPHLERWFLRHPQALATMRELLAALSLRRAFTLVSCGSWAWAWLRAALQADALFPEPLALAALDAEALGSWFGSKGERRVVCREPGGKWLIRPEGLEPPGEASDFLRHLAAEARGNPTVARALFTAALRRAPEDAFYGVELPRSTVRLTAVAWSRVARPSLARTARFEEIAVLHSLLLHGGLSVAVLERVLPFARAALSRCLGGLAAARLVEDHGGEWCVSAAGYPAVRRELASAGIPADGL